MIWRCFTLRPDDFSSIVEKLEYKQIFQIIKLPQSHQELLRDYVFQHDHNLKLKPKTINKSEIGCLAL